jgi:alpha-L-rhamnosidase
MPPIRVERTAAAKLLDRRVYDFGMNLAGDTEIFLRGARGSVVEMIYGERLDEHGDIDQVLIKRHPTIPRNQIDHYICAGDPAGERWHTDFSYKGFRYVQIVGDCEVLELTTRVFHTRIERAGSFTCSHPVLEAIHQATIHSTLTNYHHIPTDCPHREKNGWTGDAHLSSEQALYNFDLLACYEQYLDDVVDCQWPSGQLPCIAPTSVYGFNWQSGPTWDAALILMPWNLYRFTGDTVWLRRWYPAMRKYLRYAESISEGHICASGLGDFLPDPSVEVCPAPMMLTGFVMHLAQTAAKIAKLLGEEDDAAEFSGQAEAARRAVRARYIETDTPRTESFLATAAYFGLADDAQAVADELAQAVRKNGHRSGGGVFGSVFALDVLTEHGHFEDALSLAAQTEFPSWGYMLRDGGNTLWEHWSGKVGSLNHHMRSPIDAWFYRSIAGMRIDDEAPGFAHIIFQPHFSPRVERFAASHRCRFGEISARLENGSYTVAVLAGATGTVHLGGETVAVRGGESATFRI